MAVDIERDRLVIEFNNPYISSHLELIKYWGGGDIPDDIPLETLQSLVNILVGVRFSYNTQVRLGPYSINIKVLYHEGEDESVISPSFTGHYPILKSYLREVEFGIEEGGRREQANTST